MLIVAISHSLTRQVADCAQERDRSKMELGYPGAKAISFVNHNSLYHVSATIKFKSTHAFYNNARYDSFLF